MMIFLTGMLACSLMACGNSSTSSVASSSPSISPSSSEEEKDTEKTELQELNVAYMPNYASLCSVAAGIEKGYFEEQGFKINLVQFADGPTIIAAMESGAIDIGYIGQGAHKLCINGKATIFSLSHISNGDAVIGLKSNGIASMADLAGKTIAYSSGTSSETIINNALAEAGLTVNDVTLMDMDASNIVTAMLSGSIDACATWSPNTKKILDELGEDGIQLCDNKTFIDETVSLASWIAMPKYAEENRDTLLNFTKALYKGMDYRADEKNYDEVSNWVAEIEKLDVADIKTQTGDADWITSSYIVDDIPRVEALYKTQQNEFIQSGAVEKEVPVSDYVMLDLMEEAGKN